MCLYGSFHIRFDDSFVFVFDAARHAATCIGSAWRRPGVEARHEVLCYPADQLLLCTPPLAPAQDLLRSLPSNPTARTRTIQAIFELAADSSSMVDIADALSVQQMPGSPATDLREMDARADVTAVGDARCANHCTAYLLISPC